MTHSFPDKGSKSSLRKTKVGTFFPGGSLWKQPQWSKYSVENHTALQPDRKPLITVLSSFSCDSGIIWMYKHSSVTVFYFTNPPRRLKCFLLILHLQLHKKNNCLKMVYPYTVFTGILDPEPFYNIHVYIFLTLKSLLECPSTVITPKF